MCSWTCCWLFTKSNSTDGYEVHVHFTSINLLFIEFTYRWHIYLLFYRALGFEPRRDEIKKIVNAIVKDESDTISLEQFISLMTEKISEKGAREEILKAFRLFDDQQTGKISLANLKRVAQELGENLTEGIRTTN